MVEIGAGKNNALNRRSACPRTRMQLWRGFDLITQIRRSTQQEPRRAIGTDGHLSLRSRLALKLSAADGMTVRTSTIPLGECSSGSGAEDLHLHQFRLQLCAHVGVNFAAEGNFFENWSGPN